MLSAIDCRKNGMNCFHCGRKVEGKERVGFRDRCPACDRPLHACLNCGFYDRRYNNECRETQAERVVDKDRTNFCDFFAPRGPATKPASAPDARAKLDALFKRKS
jgi:hypothetical protein